MNSGAQTYTEQHSDPCYFTIIETLDPNNTLKVSGRKLFYIGQDLNKSVPMEVMFQHAYSSQPILVPGVSQFEYEVDGVPATKTLKLSVYDWIVEDGWYIGARLVPSVVDSDLLDIPTEQPVDDGVRHYSYYECDLNFLITGSGISDPGTNMQFSTIGYDDPAEVYDPMNLMPGSIFDITLTTGMEAGIAYLKASWDEVADAANYEADICQETTEGTEPTEDEWLASPTSVFTVKSDIIFSPVSIGATYWVRVRSISAGQHSSVWCTASKLIAFTGVENPPTNLIATPVRYLAIKLTWTAPTGNEYDLDHYNVYRSESSDPATAIHITDTRDCYYSDVPPNPSDAVKVDALLHYYWVTAVSVAGQESVKSNIASATVKALNDYTLEANSLYDSLKGIDAKKLMAKDILSYSGVFVNRFRSCTCKITKTSAANNAGDQAINISSGTLKVAAFTYATTPQTLDQVDLTSASSITEISYPVSAATYDRTTTNVDGVTGFADNTNYWIYVLYPIDLNREPTSGGTTLTPYISGNYPTYERNAGLHAIVLGFIRTGTAVQDVVVDGVHTQMTCWKLNFSSANALGTTISGDMISTGSITADNIAVGTITADNIKAGAITADMITAGILKSKDDLSHFNLTTGYFNIGDKLVYDNTTSTLSMKGNISASTITGGTVSGAKVFSEKLDGSTYYGCITSADPTSTPSWTAGRILFLNGSSAHLGDVTDFSPTTNLNISSYIEGAADGSGMTVWSRQKLILRGTGNIAIDNPSGTPGIEFRSGNTPKGSLYVKTSDGKLYFCTTGGTEYEVGSGTGTAVFA